MDFYLILALGPRNGLGYCVVNRHKVKGGIIIIIIIIIFLKKVIIITKQETHLKLHKYFYQPKNYSVVSIKK